MKKITATIGVVAFAAAANMGAAKSCDNPSTDKTVGDGITQFGCDNDGKDVNYANKGGPCKLNWGKTYNAHKVNPGDVENCEWSLYMMDKIGRTTFIKKGNYRNAKIKVGAQVTRRVFLKSLDCGNWE